MSLVVNDVVAGAAAAAVSAVGGDLCILIYFLPHSCICIRMCMNELFSVTHQGPLDVKVTQL